MTESRAMRTVVVGPVYPFRGGIAHFTTHLSDAFQAHGHTVLTISYLRQYPSWLYPGKSDRDPSKEAFQVEAEYLLDPLNPLTWPRSARRVTGFDPDLVVLQWWNTFWGPAMAALGTLLNRAGFHPVYLVHNVLPHEEKPWDRLLARLALQRGKAFVVLTPRERERLLRLVPEANVRTATHPIYRMRPRRISREEARNRLKLPLDSAVLLFFGIVRPYKGLPVLLDALAILKDQGFQPTLLIGGEFWEGKEDALQQIERLRLGEQVRVDDRYIPDEEAAVLFSAADALAAPYTGGTQSGAAEMALGFGLPLVVTTRVAEGLAQEHRSAALVVPPGDASSLADAIRDVLAKADHQQPDQKAEESWGQLIDALVSFSQEDAV